MLDHIFLTVSDAGRSIAFYEAVLPVLGIVARLDYDGRNAPAGHPDLKGFGANGRIFFWLRVGTAAPDAAHVGFVATSKAMVDETYSAALAAGACAIHAPGPQLHYDPRYYAAQVRDPDGYSLEFVYKNWQHGHAAVPAVDPVAVAHALIAATNAYDVEAALMLFRPDGVIDDPSTGHRFEGHQGIRAYIERYFVGYHTVTRMLSVARQGAESVRARVDFTGDFGHEIGVLDIAVDAEGRIIRIDASLE